MQFFNSMPQLGHIQARQTVRENIWQPAVPDQIRHQVFHPFQLRQNCGFKTGVCFMQILAKRKRINCQVLRTNPKKFTISKLYSFAFKWNQRESKLQTQIPTGNRFVLFRATRKSTGFMMT